jgi:NDP-sugar pyrophosphorylase family protein
VIKIGKIKQAIILAGGEGTRLKPITEKVPKPMVEVNDQPFLNYIFELLAENEISDIVLCVSYLWEKIQEYFGDTYNSDHGKTVKLHYSVEPRLFGTGGAIINAKGLLDDYFFVLNGDTYMPIDYQAIGQVIIERGIIGALAVYDNQEKIVNNNIKINDEGFVEIYNKHQVSPDMTGVDAGANVFSKKLLDYLPREIPDNQKISLEIDIYPKLIKEHQLFGYLTDIRFYDMGTLDRMKIISEVLK